MLVDEIPHRGRRGRVRVRGEAVEGRVEPLVLAAERCERFDQTRLRLGEQRPEVTVLALVVVTEHGDDEVAQRGHHVGAARTGSVGEKRCGAPVRVVHDAGLDDGGGIRCHVHPRSGRRSCEPTPRLRDNGGFVTSR
jgi:hypothetical protein